MNFGARLCGEVLLQRSHIGVILHPIDRKHMASLFVSRLLCLFIYTVQIVLPLTTCTALRATFPFQVAIAAVVENYSGDTHCILI